MTPSISIMLSICHLGNGKIIEAGWFMYKELLQKVTKKLCLDYLASELTYLRIGDYGKLK